MGGPGSGGTRIGSGGKPKSARARWLRGRPGSPRPPAAPSVDPPLLPAGLTDAERAIWLTLAPHAVVAGTLTPATQHDFLTLVQLTVEAAELLEARRAAGWGRAGQALSRAYRHVVQRQEAKLRGFALSPIGKPMLSSTPVETDDPFAEFDVPLPLGRYKG
jgi:hypothetical protein